MIGSLFVTFLKIGLFTFGGGYAMIAQIKEYVVEKKKWLTDEELLEIIAIAESTPGPIAINLATFVGYKKKGILGSIVATLGVIIPSLIIIYCISIFLSSLMENKIVQYAFIGIKCSVCFLILKAGLTMLIKLIKQVELNNKILKLFSLFIFTFSFITLIILEIFSINFSSIFLILIGGFLSISFYSLINHFKRGIK